MIFQNAVRARQGSFHTKKDILFGCPFLYVKARDGAIGPGDQCLAPTEEDFRSSETSN